MPGGDSHPSVQYYLKRALAGALGPGFSPDNLLLSTEVTFYSIRCKRISLRDMMRFSASWSGLQPIGVKLSK